MKRSRLFFVYLDFPKSSAVAPYLCEVLAAWGGSMEAVVDGHSSASDVADNLVV
ncbi:hypothetical protein Pint_35174 [Pistacia integerrima]|uniref:Uncharacterized protein n=1 Tax=Pistacia integerrima TaxID=434235 RepID=A0ACC0Y1K3_9ROSI|nr:hypothetical protein Pint_35174 [Pistacia integerrima]